MAEIPERLAKAAEEAEERIAAQLGPSSARDAMEAMWPAIEALAESIFAAGVQAGREAGDDLSGTVDAVLKLDGHKIPHGVRVRIIDALAEYARIARGDNQEARDG